MAATQDRTAWADIADELEALKEKGLKRALRTIPSRRRPGVLDFSSNDYLGLSLDARVAQKAAEAARRWGGGSGASRLISGDLAIHEKLERAIADLKRESAALVFSSGYLANLGVLSAFLDERDVVLLDRFNHASLVDAARLCRAKLWVYPHRDMARLAELLGRAASFRRRMVVTDSYFSMDGDVAPLDEMHKICRRSDAMLMVDEAHATGVFGENGGGLTERFGLSGRLDVVMGTLSKAIGSVGGFVAGRRELRDLLINRARTFIYTTAPAPAASGAALESLRLIATKPAMRERLWANIQRIRLGLEAQGWDLMGSEGPIVPVLVGDASRAMRLSDRLKKKGVFVPAIRPPTVKRGTERLRLSVSAAHRASDIDHLLESMRKIRKAAA